MKHVAALLFLVPALLFGYPLQPDEDVTPGEFCDTANPDFREFRYREKIPYCERNVDSATKNKVYESYNIPKSERGLYTIDHLIPLSLGGSNSIENLWPEHRKVKALRPNLEMSLYIAIRDGRITQDEAVDTILEAKWDPCAYDGIDAEPNGSDACLRSR